MSSVEDDYVDMDDFATDDPVPAEPEPEVLPDDAEEGAGAHEAKAHTKEERHRSAQKRIDQEVRRRRETERAAAALDAQLREAQAELQRLRQERDESSLSALESEKASLRQQWAETRRKAVDLGDDDALGQLAEIEDNLAEATLRVAQAKVLRPQQAPPPPQQPSPQPQINYAQAAWLKSNPWYMQDQAKQQEADKVYHALVNSGQDPEDFDFYRKLDDAIKRRPQGQTPAAPDRRGFEGSRPAEQHLDAIDKNALRKIYGDQWRDPANVKAYFKNVKSLTGE